MRRVHTCCSSRILRKLRDSGYKRRDVVAGHAAAVEPEHDEALHREAYDSPDDPAAHHSAEVHAMAEACDRTAIDVTVLNAVMLFYSVTASRRSTSRSQRHSVQRAPTASQRSTSNHSVTAPQRHSVTASQRSTLSRRPAAAPFWTLTLE